MTHNELLAKINEDFGYHGLIPALRAVVELHKEKDDNTCAECWDAEDDWRLAYPCPTIQAIEKELK